jgi:hypothetical protein
MSVCGFNAVVEDGLLFQAPVDITGLVREGFKIHFYL